MELDDLKDTWRSSSQSINSDQQQDERELLQILSASRRSFGRNLLLDLLISITIYIASLVVIILFETTVAPFFFKLVIITTLFVIPIYYRMYNSYSFLKEIDYGSDVKSNLLAYLTHHKYSIKFYKWGTYFLVTVLVLVFITDETFMKLDHWIKSIIFGYFLIIATVTGPIVSRLYGKRIREIESLNLDEKTS